MATQATLLTSLRLRLNETTPAVWTEAELRGIINEVVRDIARRTLSLRSEVTLYSTDGLGNYTLPNDCLQVHLVEYTESGWTTYPEFRDRHSMQNAWGAFQNNTGMPMVFTTWGYPPNMEMKLYPVPSDTGASIKVLYYKFPENLATDSTADADRDLDLPAGWDDLILDGGEAKALRKGRDSRWQEAQALYETHVAEMADMTMRFTDQAGSINWDGTPDWLTSTEGW